MTPKQMLAKPIEKRRGAVWNESDGFTYILVTVPADEILDRLLADGVIGAARRNCLSDVLAGNVPRPIGKWGMLVRLKGHPSTYVLGDATRDEWQTKWAAGYGWRVALFSSNGIGGKLARLNEGKREMFHFISEMSRDAEKGFAHYKKINEEESAMIRGEADVCSQAWLDKLKSGAQAVDLLAKFSDMYVPVWIHHTDKDGKAGVYGWDGDAHPEGDDELYAEFPDSAFERVDVFTFGAADTLEPSPAALALTEAVRAGDAAGAKAAIAQGADPNVLADDDKSPLAVALNLGSPYLPGGRFKKVSLEKQLALLKVLLEAGAKPDLPGDDPAIHQAIHWAESGSEETIIAQLRVLLDYGANPNATGSFLRSAGSTPLHVVAKFHPWIGVLKLLLSRGADVKAKDHQGKTPRELAQKHLDYLNEAAKKADGTPGAKTSGMAKLFAGMMGVMQEEQNKKTQALRANIAFLAAAERGKADLSDIDAIAAESSKKLEEQKIDDKKKSAGMLEGMMKAMGMDKDLAPAQKMVEQNKQIFVERHEKRHATDADFSGKDRAWYDVTTATLQKIGFRALGDLVNTTVEKTNGLVVVTRSFLSADGTTVGAIYHFVAGKMNLRVCEFESELSDGTFIGTSNAEASKAITLPPQIRSNKMPAATTPENLLKEHNIAKANALTRKIGVQFKQIRSMEDCQAMQDRQMAIKAAFRKEIGYVDPAEVQQQMENKNIDPIATVMATASARIVQGLQKMKDEEEAEKGAN